MEGSMKGEGGKGVVGVSEDEASDGMQCINHPHRNNPPGSGICAFCLQEKLGKLVSSSFPLPITASNSSSSPPPSSSPPSFRSHTVATSSSSLSLSLPTPTTYVKKNTNHNHDHYMRSRLPFLLPKKKKKKKEQPSMINPSSSSSSSDVVLKRSKSTVTPRRTQFLCDEEDLSPRKRNGFWSFLYLSSAKHSASSIKKLEAKSFRDSNSNNSSPRISIVKPRDKCLGSSSLGMKSDMVVDEEEEEEENSAYASGSVCLERKVSRSRSVGCGSRSFSGDFFERISTGFGDCTLRRVESQREGGNNNNKPNKVASAAVAGTGNHHHCMKERVRCGGIFGGFMMMTSSSSSSSSSSYWVDDGINGEGRGGSGSTKSWGWALASPMRAFTAKTTSSKDNNNNNNKKRDEKNTRPNLSAVPSLLTVRG